MPRNNLLSKKKEKPYTEEQVALAVAIVKKNFQENFHLTKLLNHSAYQLQLFAGVSTAWVKQLAVVQTRDCCNNLNQFW